MKKGKKKGGVYEFLLRSGVLDTGDDALIAAARRKFWSAYKAEWRRNQRKRMKKYEIALTEQEAKRIMAEAKRHRRSATRFIKESCLAYLNKRYLPVDPLALATIEQLLTMNYTALRQLFDESKTPFEVGRLLLSQMVALEEKVTRELYHPREQ